MIESGENMQNILLETLARSEYAAPVLRNAKQLGVRQYLDFASNLAPFKLRDAEGMHKARIVLSKNGRISQLEVKRYAKELPCFCNMLGVSYKMPLPELQGLISALSKIFKEGSTIVFDRPDSTSFEVMEKMFEKCGFLIFEYIESDEIQARFLDRYNRGEHKFSPISDINFYTIVRKG